jgi:hypothetical protein
MNRVVRISLGIFVSLIVLGTLTGVGLASANPPFYGQTYAKAAAKIESNGQKADIATIIGSQLPTDDCIVTNAYQSFTLNSKGRRAHGGTWMLDLNCINAVASPGKPGNSTMTIEGKRAKAFRAQAQLFNRNIPKILAKGEVPSCGKSHDKAQSCLAICMKAGICSDEVLKYLASV